MRHLRHLPAREGEEVSHGLSRERVLLFAFAATVLVAAKLGLPLCPFAAVLGVPCPGCGLARATLSVLGGDFSGAFMLHPLVLVAVPAAVVLALYATDRRSQTPGRERAVAVGSAVLLVMMLAVWISRFAGAFGGPVSVV